MLKKIMVALVFAQALDASSSPSKTNNPDSSIRPNSFMRSAFAVQPAHFDGPAGQSLADKRIRLRNAVPLVYPELHVFPTQNLKDMPSFPVVPTSPALSEYVDQPKRLPLLITMGLAQASGKNQPYKIFKK